MPPLNFNDDTDFLTRDFSNSHAKGSSIGREDRTNVFINPQQNDIDPTWKFAYPPKRKNCRKSVSFHEHIRVEFLPTRYDWSEEEKNSRWITNNDYLGFQLDVSNTLFLLRNEPESIDDASHSSRGVECRDPSITHRRRNARNEAKNIVFEWQRMYKQINNNNDQDGYLIACLSLLAQNSMQQALDFAAQDELDAKKFQNVVHHPPNNVDDDDLLFGYDEISLLSTKSQNSSFISTDTSTTASSDDTTDFDNSWLREYF